MPPIVTCPHCDHPVDTHHAIGDPATVPSVGDVAACYHCGEPSIYDTTPDGPTLRSPNSDELEWVLGHKATLMVRAARIVHPEDPVAGLAAVREQVGSTHATT